MKPKTEIPGREISDSRSARNEIHPPKLKFRVLLFGFFNIKLEFQFLFSDFSLGKNGSYIRPVHTVHGLQKRNWEIRVSFSGGRLGPYGARITKTKPDPLYLGTKAIYIILRGSSFCVGGNGKTNSIPHSECRIPENFHSAFANGRTAVPLRAQL